jgi:Phage tail protein
MSQQISKLEIILPNGIATDLSDRVNYIHIGNDNWGLPPIERFSEQGPLQDGNTDLGFRLQARQINLSLMLLARSHDEYYERRGDLLRLFTPRDSMSTLRFTKPNGDIRLIDVHIASGLNFSSSDRKGYVAHNVAVTLIAPDPTWYAPVTESVNPGIDIIAGDGFEIPWSFPWNIGSSALVNDSTITYTGSYKTYPIITVTGPATNLIITNTATGDKLDFTGSTIDSGAVYTIDTRYGYKSVTDQNGVSQIAKLTTDSDLSTFSIVPDPDAPGGVNAITIVGASGTGSTQVVFQYYNRYIGV